MLFKDYVSIDAHFQNSINIGLVYKLKLRKPDLSSVIGLLDASLKMEQ